MSLDWIDDELRALAEADLLRQRVQRSAQQGPKVTLDGVLYLNFGSNDYLGIAADEALASVIDKTHKQCGWGSGSSPLIVGRTTLQTELERRLAAFTGCEAALLFPTGYAANIGTLPCLVGEGDVLFSDAKNHASLIDGCRLSKADVVVYPHNDMSQLERALKRAQAQSPSSRKLIVSDALFSMDGDLALMEELVALAESFRATLYVDEAHALGVCGETGQGVSHGYGDRVGVRVGTLSKALGSHGGFVAGSQSLIDYLANRARSYVFSTAAPAANAAVGLAALRIVREQPERRARVAAHAERVRTALRQQGWNIGTSQSHIVPVIVGTAAAALELSAKLRGHKIWVPCIRPPSVPEGEALLRISLSSAHVDSMIDVLLDTLYRYAPGR